MSIQGAVGQESFNSRQLIIVVRTLPGLQLPADLRNCMHIELDAVMFDSC